jgi:GNAT superfamily N-acetyltransferase
MAELRGACDPEEWEHGGHALDDGPAAGVFVDGRLTALAGYTRWGGRLAHLSVVTHPAWRGHGFARAAVAHVATHGAAGGLPDPAASRLAFGTFVGAAVPQLVGGMAEPPWTPGRTEDAGGVVFFGDSVVLRVGPRGVPHGDFMLRGRFTGDSARGLWEREGVGTAGLAPLGRFVLRRAP